MPSDEDLFDDEMDEEEIAAHKEASEDGGSSSKKDRKKKRALEEDEEEETIDIEAEGLDLGNVIEGGRSSRARGRKKKSALDDLRAQRESGVSRSHALADDDDDGARIYDEYDEATYTKIVNEHMEEDDFVVDDEGGASGYVDHGGELDYGYGYDYEEFEVPRKRKNRGTKTKRRGGRKQAVEDEPELVDPRERVSAMFAASAATSRMGGPTTKARARKAEIDLDDMLASFNSGDAGSRKKRAPVRTPSSKKQRLDVDLELSALETSNSKDSGDSNDAYVPDLLPPTGSTVRITERRHKLDPYSEPPPQAPVAKNTAAPSLDERDAIEEGDTDVVDVSSPPRTTSKSQHTDDADSMEQEHDSTPSAHAKEATTADADDEHTQTGMQVETKEDAVKKQLQMDLQRSLQAASSASGSDLSRDDKGKKKVPSWMVYQTRANNPPSAASSSSSSSSAAASSSSSSASGAGSSAAANFSLDAGTFTSFGGNASSSQDNDSPKTGSQELGKTSMEEEDGSVLFYMLDACEQPTQGGRNFGNTSTVYLFGKVWVAERKQHVSTCITVNNIERELHFLPRKQDAPLSDEDKEEMLDEVEDLLEKYHIRRYKSRWVTMKYAFEERDVPAESEYLEIVHSAGDRTMPRLTQGNTFSRVFGTNTNTLELLLLGRQIKGPCWLRVDNATVMSRNQSWCRHHLAVDTPASLSVCEQQQAAPHLVVMSLHVKTIMNHKTRTNDVVSFSAIVHRNVVTDGPTPDPSSNYEEFNAVRRLDSVFPVKFRERANAARINLDMCGSERELLNLLMAKIHRTDPDVIVGHNFIGFDLDVLLHRMQMLNVHGWSKLGRLNRSHFPKMQKGAGGTTDSTYAERAIMSGRLIVDTYLQARDLIRQTQYTLTALTKSQLPKHKRIEIDSDRVVDSFNSANDLMYLIACTQNFAFLSLELMFKLQIVPLTHQLTCLAGNLWGRTLTGGRAERNEFLLLHEFHRLGYVKPDKITWLDKKREEEAAAAAASSSSSNTDANDNMDLDTQAAPTSSRRKPKYMGGLVLEPKAGLYDTYVLLLDFNSLYPSIIQEYNIDFTTVERPQAGADGDVPMADVPPKELEQGVLPTVLKTLIDRRKVVKGMIKSEKKNSSPDAGLLQQYDIRSRALKLTANSMYGCLGFTHSRFYAPSLASLITSKGREILQATVDVATDQLSLDVIYGDTDSIMVDTKTTDKSEVYRIGEMVKQVVNQRYRKLEIEIDGMYKCMLLLRKKKYAALVEDSQGRVSTEMKGIDSVRRDWCDLSKDVSNHCLKVLLSGATREDIVESIHAFLRQVGDDVGKAHSVPLGKFVIKKSLTKAVEAYADAGKSLPHLAVAKALMREGKPVRVGDVIEYVVVTGESSQIAERSVHPTKVRDSEGELQLDYEWYLANQVLPPVSRLCAVIQGTDQAQLADCLGLDSSKYTEVVRSGGGDGDDDEAEFVSVHTQGAAEAFRACEKIMVKCRNCGFSEALQGVCAVNASGQPRNGMRCARCAQMYDQREVWNRVRSVGRECTRRFYRAESKCDDSTCGNVTRQLSTLRGGGMCLQAGCNGTMVPLYTSTQLYNQMLYHKYLFDMERARSDKGRDTLNDCFVNPNDEEVFVALRNAASNMIAKSKYSLVSLAPLFEL